MQSAQFLVAARRIKGLVDALAPGTRVYCNEIGVLAPVLPFSIWIDNALAWCKMRACARRTCPLTGIATLTPSAPTCSSSRLDATAGGGTWRLRSTVRRHADLLNQNTFLHSVPAPGFVYGELAALGVDGMAASQLTGYPGNAVSISMLECVSTSNTGKLLPLSC